MFHMKNPSGLPQSFTSQVLCEYTEIITLNSFILVAILEAYRPELGRCHCLHKNTTSAGKNSYQPQSTTHTYRAFQYTGSGLLTDAILGHRG